MKKAIWIYGHNIRALDQCITDYGKYFRYRWINMLDNKVVVITEKLFVQKMARFLAKKDKKYMTEWGGTKRNDKIGDCLQRL